MTWQGEAGKDLLSFLLTARDDVSNEQMTDQQLVDECLTFLIAGSVFCHIDCFCDTIETPMI